MTRLGFADREIEFLSYGEFYDLYQEYKKMFDIENMLRCAKKTYADLEEEAAEQEEIINF